MSCSLNLFYSSIGVTKQGFHGYLERQMHQSNLEAQVLKLVTEIRKDHPTMGVREMYFKLNLREMGRDKFEQMCRANKLTRTTWKNFRITTDSSGVTRFDNLLEGLKIVRINQIWQSDITYFECGPRFYYITLIQDAFTKVIVGHKASKTLHTEDTTIPALQTALKRYAGLCLDGLTLHSDGGGQYYAKKFLAITKAARIINSMGKSCYENAMAESLNGVIKNKYLYHKEIKTFNDLEKQLDRTVRLYNQEKPHSGLSRSTPETVEKKCLSLLQERNEKKNKSSLEKPRKERTLSSIHSNQKNTQIQKVLKTKRILE